IDPLQQLPLLKWQYLQGFPYVDYRNQELL
ncbi:hypothetical protein CP061683_0023B, partial [Chlamydia psittaci 06-1683]